jgi:YidC/Oxa1 family membrane protein insertase
VPDSRNMILAVVLSALVLLGWNFVADRWLPVASKPPVEYKDGKKVVVAQPGANPTVDTPSAVRDRAVVLGESQRVKIATPSLEGSLNLKGARFDDLVLVRHRETIAKNSPAIRLLSPSGAAGAYFGEFGWQPVGNVAVPGKDTLWTADGQLLAPGKPVTLSWDNGQGLTFRIALAVDENYMFTVTQSVENRGAAAAGVHPYGLISRAGASKDPTSWTQHVGPIGSFDGKMNYDVDYKALQQGKVQQTAYSSTGGWIGFTDKYWLTALVPDQKLQASANFRFGQPDRFQTDMSTPQQVVAPGARAQTVSHFFAGAKEVGLLDSYRAQLGIPLFDRAIDWGWFYWFEKPIFYLLDWLFRQIGNFGVAIILLTIIVRGLMFPVAQRQFASMAKMRAIQPKMKAIQDKHKDDKAKAQQEVLALYQREKVNPVAGCLPMFLQIPVFYALYKVLNLTIEMRHQPFALWIHDLSAPDPLTPLNLFGLLPFQPPHFIALGVLPILLGITMYLQQKLNPQPMDPAQKQVFAIMPWMFMIIMAPFAAGLQLYWVVSNTLTILQQKLLYSRHPSLTEAPAK